MISDRHVDFSLTALAAWAFWLAVVAGLSLAAVTDNPMWAYIALAASAAAATLHIRSFMCVFAHRMKAAFDLGREVEQQHQRERELRSV